MLKMPAICDDFLRLAAVAQDVQQQLDGVRQRYQRSDPFLDVGTTQRSRAPLPRVVDGHVKLTAAPRDAAAVAECFEPLVPLQQVAAGLAAQRTKLRGAFLHLRQYSVEHGLGDGRVATPSLNLLFLAIKVFERVGLEVGAVGGLKQLEQRHQRKVMIQRTVTLDELLKALKQVPKPQISAYALVEGIFVKNHRARKRKAGSGKKL